MASDQSSTFQAYEGSKANYSNPNQAAQETKSMVLTYNGKIALPASFRQIMEVKLSHPLNAGEAHETGSFRRKIHMISVKRNRSRGRNELAWSHTNGRIRLYLFRNLTVLLSRD